MPDIFLSAGEASGDHYGAELMREMRERLGSGHKGGEQRILRSAQNDKDSGELKFFGLCGPEMRSLGCDPVVQAESVAHMGITEVVRHAPFIYRQLQKLKSSLARRKPALAVMIDFPDVNFRLAKQCHARGIPVLWLVSPQLWAWKKRRIRWVRRWVTKMLVIFPFEQEFYRERGVDAEFIGHPLADLELPAITRDEFAHAYGLNKHRQWIAMLPGSRKREFDLHFETMVQAAKLLGHEYQYIVPIAATLGWDRYARRVAAAGFIPVRDAREALYFARASVVASGTATVQAALMGNPFVIVYRMSPLSYRLARTVVDVRFAGMPNLIAGREIVPELLQESFTAANIAQNLRVLLEDGALRKQQIKALSELRRSLTPTTATLTNELRHSAMARAADAALALVAK